MRWNDSKTNPCCLWAEQIFVVNNNHGVCSDTAKVENANRKEPLMKPYGDCTYCGGEVVECVQRVDYRLHGQLYILEGVPAGVCQQCGEQFFTADVARQMESVVTDAKGPLETVPIPVIAVK